MFGWQPGIGDPTSLGWFTVLAYAGAALLCFRCYQLSLPSASCEGISRVRRRFWMATVLILVALGINKQLDLQSLLTAIGRTLAKNEGWYASRRSMQYDFIICVASIGALAAATLICTFRRAGAWVQLAQVGLIILFTFVVVRAASFHHVDEMLRRKLWLFSLNHVLELGGIAVISVAAVGAGLRR